MRSVVVSLWALFAGLALIAVGVGLQATLLGVRASLSGFGTGVTGAVMACYYLGFMLLLMIMAPFSIKASAITGKRTDLDGRYLS